MNAIKKIFYILLLLVTFVFSTNSLADSVDKVTKNEVVGDSCKIAKFAVSNNTCIYAHTIRIQEVRPKH